LALMDGRIRRCDWGAIFIAQWRDVCGFAAKLWFAEQKGKSPFQRFPFFTLVDHPNKSGDTIGDRETRSPI